MSCHSLCMQYWIMVAVTVETSWWKGRLIERHQTKQTQSQKQKLDKALRTDWNKQLWNETEGIYSGTKKRRTFWRTGFPTCCFVEEKWDLKTGTESLKNYEQTRSTILWFSSVSLLFISNVDSQSPNWTRWPIEGMIYGTSVQAYIPTVAVIQTLNTEAGRQAGRHIHCALSDQQSLTVLLVNRVLTRIFGRRRVRWQETGEK
jgi:hypothetical protein